VAIIYKIHYDNAGKAYIGSSLSEDPNYWGSMSRRGEDRMRDDHARAGLSIVRRREILWQGPADATLLSREYALITKHRTNIPAYGYNLMPMLPGVNLPLVFRWNTPRGVSQSTINCPYGVYTGHYHGEPEFWTTFTDLDGATVEVYRGPSKTKAWNDYLAHKDVMVKLLRLDLRENS
jgi:hypothetical protein